MNEDQTYPKMNAELAHLGIYAEDLGVLDIANEVIKNEKFRIWSGSPHPDMHHYGNYGLLIHTAEVIHLCLSSIDTLDLRLKVDTRLMFLAALFHDFGKIEDYECVDGVWQSTEHKYKIYHITKSYLLWNQAVAKHGFDAKEADEISHAILAHHGRLEWKSPVTPRTKMAWILHLCDNMSARVCDTPEIWKQPEYVRKG